MAGISYGNLVDYRPGERAGTFEFQDKQGNWRMFGGPAAQKAADAMERIKATAPKPTAMIPVKKSAAVADVPTPVPGAESDGGAGGSAGGVELVGKPGGFGGQVPSFAEAPAPAPQSPAAPAPQAAGPATATPAAAGPSNPPEFITKPEAYRHAPGTPPPDFKPQYRTKDGYMGTMPDGTVVEYVLPKAGSRGGLIEKSRTVKGGTMTAEEANFWAERERQRGEAMGQSEVVGRTVAMERASAQRGFLEEQIRQQQAQMQENQARQQELAQRVNIAMQREERARNNYLASPTRPERSTAQTIVNAFAAGLGAIGATLGRTENFALNIINKQTDDEIAAMQQDMALRKEGADNALSKLTEELGSLDQAKQSYALMNLQQAKNEWELIGSLGSDQEQTAAAQKALVAIQAEMDQRLLALRQLTEGEVTRSIVNQPGSAGTTGGIRLPTVEEATSLTGLKSKEVSTEAGQLANVKAARSLAGGAPEGEQAKSLLGHVNAMDAMSKILAKNEKEGGKPWTPEGQNLGAKFIRGLVDAGLGDNTYKEWLSSKTRSRADTFGTLRQAMISIGTQLTGAGAPSEGEAIRSAAASAQSEEQLINVIRTYRPILGAKLKAYQVDIPTASGDLKKE